ncbi:DUF2231 domain-containing protein [Nocardioides sp. Iso805N]|uniref:DUF2231 domain-containing protein n=1 Tax=Nocardioides sp. Iso805N TaxID=1283287 RepID=UPI00036A54BD|nr:DUF2231 domain-containing protein [Nocardioides sp. Iso805N]
MSAPDNPSQNPLVDLTHALEQDGAFDDAVDILSRYAEILTERPGLQSLLRGDWFGHHLHPTLTDFPLGAWMSASLLDLIGPEGSEEAAARLVGLGVLGALPTALSGLADWQSLAERRDRRVGVVHAAGNAAALAAYSCSWIARRRGRHRLGAALGLLGAGLSGGAGYLGGHLAEHGTFEE